MSKIAVVKTITEYPSDNSYQPEQVYPEYPWTCIIPNNKKKT